MVDYEVVGCRCKNRYCDTCAPGLGYQLRKRVLKHGELRKFTSIQMWTLTIDPTLFESAEECYEHCRRRRVISELVRKLWDAGVLLSKHYFCAVEFQKNGFVHYHLLVDARHIPFEMVCSIWNRFRPKSAGPVKHAEFCKCSECVSGGTGEIKERPGFGSVRFSMKSRGLVGKSDGKFSGAKHAINYATKYVIKVPKEGWPQWVKDSRKNIPRYQTSKGILR